MGDRTDVQTTESEFSITLFLWRKRERYKNSNLDNSYCKSAANGHPEKSKEQELELFRFGHYHTNHPYVLYQLLLFP